MAKKQYVGLMLDEKIKDKIKARAEKENRTMSNMIECLLIEALNDDKSGL